MKLLLFSFSLLLFVSFSMAQGDIQAENITTYDTVGIGARVKVSFQYSHTFSLHQYLNSKLYVSADTILSEDDELIGSTDGIYLYVQGIYQYEMYTDSLYKEPGEYYLILSLDPEDVIYESNETNNTFSSPIYIAEPQHDLYLEFEPGQDTIITESYQGVINISRINRGNINSIASISFYLSEDTILEQDDLFYHLENSLFYRPPIPEVLSTSLLLNFHKEGSYYLITHVDENNQIIESNETNNLFYKPIFIREKKVDIRLDTIGLSTDTIVEGETLTIYTQTSTEGNLPISYNVNYYLSGDTLLDANDRVITNRDVYNLHNDTTDWSITYTPEPLEKDTLLYLIASADPKDSLHFSTSNNTKYKAILIENIIPDGTYSLHGISIPDTITTMDYHHDIKFPLLNIGNMSLFNTKAGLYFSTDSVYDSNDNLLYESWISIPEKSSLEWNPYISLSDSLDPGKYYVVLYVDHLQNVKERDETNNILILPVYVKKLDVDLVILDLKTNPVLLTEGEAFEIIITIKNQGTSPIVQADEIFMDFFSSTDTITHSNSFYMNFRLGLKEGETKTYTISVPAENSPVPLNPYLSALTGRWFYPEHERNRTNNSYFIETGIFHQQFYNVLELDNLTEEASPSELPLQFSFNNTASTQSDSVLVHVYLSEDTIANPEESSLSIMVPNLGTGEIFNLDTTIVKPEGLDSYNYVIVNAVGFTAQHDLSNNILQFTVADPILGKNQPISHNTRIYPVPFSETITVKGVTNSTSFKLYSETGVKLIDTEVLEGSRINVEELPPGYYLIRVGSSYFTAIKE